MGRSASDNETQHLHRRQTVEMLAREDEFSARLMWTPERLRKHQTAMLRVLVRHAVTGSPWHAQRLQGVDPDSFELDDLSRLPTMSKADLVTNFDDIVTDRRHARPD